MLSKIYCISSVVLLLLISKSQTSYSQMTWNNALDMGVLDYITVRPNASINITGSFTYECWLKSDITDYSYSILNMGNSGKIMIYYNGSKFVMRINGSNRAFSTLNPITNPGEWNHLAFIYNSSNDIFSFYINGALNNSIFSPGGPPISNLNDSLYICRQVMLTYLGLLDEVRLWNRALTATEIILNKDKSLGANTGLYSGCVMALNFQGYSNSGLSLHDWSGNSNNGFFAGNPITVDLSFQPSNYLNINLSALLSGSNDYISVNDNPALSPTSEITLQAWIYPQTGSDATILHKGTPNGSVTNYSLKIADRKLAAGSITTNDTIPLNQWSHIAYTFSSNGFTGIRTFYINGEKVHSTLTGGGGLSDGGDSLYIGGSIGLPDFEGYIDEVRISDHAKPQSEIQRTMFNAINVDNDTEGDVVYNLDGYEKCNTDNAPQLNLRNEVFFSSTNISPLCRYYYDAFQNGFYIKTSGKRIPEAGLTGFMSEDTLEIALDEILTNIEIFIALNHGQESDLKISLISPEGITAEVFNQHSCTANGIVTIFAGAADSALNDNYKSFCPMVQAESLFGSQLQNSKIKGKWRLVIEDSEAGSTGRLYGWGLKFNDISLKSKLVGINYLPEGFYNPALNICIRDTVRVYLRNISSPYNIVDSAKVKYYENSQGTLKFTSDNVSADTKYYLHMKHRNSIEIWSSGYISFDGFTSQNFYDFTSEINKTYGDNMKQIDESPVKFAAFSGDINQDGNVNLSDVLIAYNDANSFITGYKVSDVTGNNITDLSDVILAYNNSNLFVVKITP